MSGYVLGADAALDLEDIWDYIASDNIDAADRWIAKLFDAFDRLTQMPRMGHTREDLTPYPVRFWTVGAYLIIYRDERQPIEIVAVTQGAAIFRHSCIGVCTDICHRFAPENDSLEMLSYSPSLRGVEELHKGTMLGSRRHDRVAWTKLTLR